MEPGVTGMVCGDSVLDFERWVGDYGWSVSFGLDWIGRYGRVEDGEGVVDLLRIR